MVLNAMQMARDPMAVHVPAPGKPSEPKGSGSSGSGSSGSKESPGKSGLQSSRGSGSSSSSASSSTSSYLQSQRNAAKRARARYTEDANRMKGQADAWRHLIEGLPRNRETLLNNTDRSTDASLKLLFDGFDNRWSSLDADMKNNEEAAAENTDAIVDNLARERTAALTQAMSQGAGESDMLRSQMMSLRVAEDNQAETNRAYKDTDRSIEASRIDLLTDTKTALNTAWNEAEADKAQIHLDSNAALSDAWIQLGNVLGQQAAYYGTAKEQDVKGGVSKQDVKASSSAGGRGGKGGKPHFDGGKPYFEGKEETSTPRVAARDPLAVHTPGSGSGSSSGSGSGSSSGSGSGSSSGSGSNNLGTGREDKGKGASSSSAEAKATAKVGGGKGPQVLNDKALQRLMDKAAKKADKAFMKAAKAQLNAYETREAPSVISQFGREVPESSFSQAPRLLQMLNAPEQASLRGW